MSDSKRFPTTSRKVTGRVFRSKKGPADVGQKPSGTAPSNDWTRRVLLIGWLTVLAIAQNTCASDEPLVHKLIPLHTGSCRLGEDHLLGEGYSEHQRLPFAIYSFFVEGPNDEKALIDLGPETVGYCNRMFRRYGLFRDLGPQFPDGSRYPDDIVQPEGNVFHHLEHFKVSPEEISHVIFTHLHADHHGMDDGTDGGAAEKLDNAMIHVSAIGWNDNLAKRKDNQWNSYVDYAFSDFLVRRQNEGKVRFEDDAEVFPGVRTVYLGGHSVCSQAVVVSIADGPAIITSDEIYLYRFLEENVLPQVRTSKDNYRSAVDRLVRFAQSENGVLIPLHDPIVGETYKKAGPRWLKELRRMSDRAIASYLSRRNKIGEPTTRKLPVNRDADGK